MPVEKYFRYYRRFIGLAEGSVEYNRRLASLQINHNDNNGFILNKGEPAFPFSMFYGDSEAGQSLYMIFLQQNEYSMHWPAPSLCPPVIITILPFTLS